MSEKNDCLYFDFKPLGNAIKKAREAKGMTREQLAEIINYAPRHIQAVENDGQYPSIELLVRLVTMFDISVDEYIFPKSQAQKTSARRRLDTLLDQLDDKELAIIEATATSLYNNKL
ncbi:MAG: helix-turn-helix transcriptional regulator [Lachnospiraceae bacterium]|jgi:transcriptional regulator with XRE-family HTH domain|nr:helix-turn-helix transcriptional regulator [Lachnospiraceae bacterium]